MTHLVRVLIFGLCSLAAGAHAAVDSPLHEAVKNQDETQIEALLAKGADVNAKDENGRTPLYMSGSKYVAEVLLARGADVHARDENGQTPLHWAARRNPGAAEVLLARGAEINAKDNKGISPLHVTAFSDRQDIAEVLLARGADVHARNENGQTPLHVTAFSGARSVAELLLAKGADVNARNNGGETPLEMAIKHRNLNVAERLKEHLVKQDRLREDLIKSNPRAVLVQLTAQLKGNPAADTIRRLIIKIADELKPAPAISEEARKHFVEGTAIVKAAKNPAQQALAAQSFTEALTVAPWWGDAYYNLGVAQELTEQYNEAEQAFTFYLLSNPGEAEKREVQDRIYALSAKRKLSGAK